MVRRQMTAEELDALYYSVGKCIWHIQYLEDALHTLLTLKVELKEPGRVSEEEAHQLLAKHRRASLGTALGTAEKHSALPASLLVELRGLKEERDWLVHRSMNQDGESLYTDDGRLRVFSRLEKIMRSTLFIKEKIVNETAVFCKSFGINEAHVEAVANQNIAAKRGET
jgi:hypothetical protein